MRSNGTEFLSAALLLFNLGSCLQAQETPGWWKAFPKVPRLESRFVQESDSAVFGKIRKEGRLQFSRGGHLRIAYGDGLLVVGDGNTLVQFDPRARTAQKFDLRSIARESPLIQILQDPRALDSSYRSRIISTRSILLEPRRQGLPKIQVEGQGDLLKKITWVDGTGARQVMELLDPRIPAAIPESAYTIRVPEGTRWIE